MATMRCRLEGLASNLPCVLGTVWCNAFRMCLPDSPTRSINDDWVTFSCSQPSSGPSVALRNMFST